MHVERQLGMRPQRLDHHWADGEVGHEVTVHHVDMNPVGARRRHRLDLLAEGGEVGRQDGGRNADRLLRHTWPQIFRTAELQLRSSS